MMKLFHYIFIRKLFCDWFNTSVVQEAMSLIHLIKTFNSFKTSVNPFMHNVEKWPNIL